MTTPATTTSTDSFGFTDGSWQSHLSDAICVRLPDPPPGYSLLEKIGEGGQGSVFRARQNLTNRIVAAKRLFGGDSAMERFDRELKVLSAFSHPAIVSVIASERSPDQRWLILDWIDGAPVDAWAAALPQSSDSVRSILRLFSEICDGVQHAHSRGVIHRDLKPSNILVDTTGRPRILDFGIAKLIDDRITYTATGSFLGTLGYAAPELLTDDAPHNAAPDIRVDVYSLGAVLYKLLTTKDPLAAIVGPNPSASQAFKIATEHRTPPRASTSNPHVSRDLDAVLLKSLHPDPHARYATVDALHSDLQHILNNRPVAAQPPTLRYMARSFVRRQRIAVTVAAAALLLILSLTIFLAFLSLRLSRQSRDLAAAAQESQRQQQVAQNLADQRKKTAESLAAMVQSLSHSPSSEATIESLDAKLRDAVALVDSGALAGDVETEMLLRSTLRSTLNDRGMLRESLAQGERLIELITAKSGPQARQLAPQLSVMSLTYSRIGDYSAAEKSIRRAIEIDLAGKPPGARPLSNYLSNLASTLHSQGKAHEAELLYRQRLADLQTRSPDRPEVIARAKRNIGAELLTQDKIEEAEHFTLEAISDLLLLDRSNPVVEDTLLRSRRNLALIRVKQNRLEEAEALQRSVVADMVTLRGSRHIDLLQERVHLATILLAANTPQKKSEALSLLRETEAIFADQVLPTAEFIVEARKLLADNQ